MVSVTLFDMERFATHLERMSSSASLRGLRLLLSCWFALVPAAVFAQEDRIVDVELVLAVDVSWSMDFEEQLIQRQGYSQAFRSEEVIDAILYGGYGRVVVTYLEWAGSESQEIVVPWTLIDSVESAHAFADSLEAGSPRHFRRTSLSSAIRFSSAQFDKNEYDGIRRVIDISGDGPNNQGGSVVLARDDAVANGITINGLPLMTNGDGDGGLGYNIAGLDVYFAECVIGGGMSFMIPVRRWEEFPLAVRRKLVLELAGRPVDHRSGLAPEETEVHFAQATDGEPSADGTDCMIGEKIWQQRRGIWNIP